MIEKRPQNEPPAVTDAKRLILSAVMYGDDKRTLGAIVLSEPCVRIFYGEPNYRAMAEAAFTRKNIVDALVAFHQPTSPRERNQLTKVDDVQQIYDTVQKYLLEANNYRSV